MIHASPVSVQIVDSPLFVYYSATGALIDMDANGDNEEEASKSEKVGIVHAFDAVLVTPSLYGVLFLSCLT